MLMQLGAVNELYIYILFLGAVYSLSWQWGAVNELLFIYILFLGAVYSLIWQLGAVNELLFIYIYTIYRSCLQLVMAVGRC